jgi:minor tail protein Z (GPZ)
MINVSVELDISAARQEFAAHQREVTLAASRAINRVADTTRAEAVRQIGPATHIRVTKIRERISVHGANPDYLIAEVTAHPYSPNLSQFDARQMPPGVSALAWEGRKVYRHAFIMPSGGVVARVTKARYPLKGLRGPSVPRTFERPDIMRALLVRIYERFPIEFARELSRRIGG